MGGMMSKGDRNEGVDLDDDQTDEKAKHLDQIDLIVEEAECLVRHKLGMGVEEKEDDIVLDFSQDTTFQGGVDEKIEQLNRLQQVKVKFLWALLVELNTIGSDTGQFDIAGMLYRINQLPDVYTETDTASQRNSELRDSFREGSPFLGPIIIADQSFSPLAGFFSRKTRRSYEKANVALTALSQMSDFS